MCIRDRYQDRAGDWSGHSEENTFTQRDADRYAAGSWVQDQRGWWYRYRSGDYPSNSWQKINHAWYYFNRDGYALTGWQALDGKWYYFGANCAMTTGWQAINGRWYYMNGEGVMLTGWQYLNGYWYYLDGSGAMLNGWQYINGRWYFLNGMGIINNLKVENKRLKDQFHVQRKNLEKYWNIIENATIDRNNNVVFVDGEKVEDATIVTKQFGIWMIMETVLHSIFLIRQRIGKVNLRQVTIVPLILIR